MSKNSNSGLFVPHCMPLILAICWGNLTYAFTRTLNSMNCTNVQYSPVCISLCCTMYSTRTYNADIIITVIEWPIQICAINQEIIHIPPPPPPPPESHTKRQATQQGYLSSFVGDGDKGTEIVYGEGKKMYTELTTSPTNQQRKDHFHLPSLSPHSPQFQQSAGGHPSVVSLVSHLFSESLFSQLFNFF